MATVQPSNNSELQLYRVLQRANLLQYFDTFISQGGDDVQQLCEAGEDEFLEIMALVGMASKPLHVRRLQKALQEWVSNPAAFEVMKKYPTHVMSIASGPQSVSPSHSLEHSSSHQNYKMTSPQSSTISTSTPWTSIGSSRALSPTNGNSLEHPSPSESPQDIIKDVLYMPEDSSFSGILGLSQPALLEHQITAIATAAALLAQSLPPFEPKSMPKKQISKEITYVMSMSADDPNRMMALRKYAAIYGRFDSKRKNDRPMSLHEISVNEAAAQLCSHFPALLTRREELFPLARQVVRDSGYQYSKGHSRAAEVLVQPKIEQVDGITLASSLSSTSPIPDLCQAENFNDLQSELTQITSDLTELTKEQERIRSALRVLLEANDHDQMKSLTSEMDDINDRQSALIKRRQKIVNAIAKYRRGISKYSASLNNLPLELTKHSLVYGTDLSKGGNKSGSSFTEEAVVSNPLNTLYMAALHNHKDSLFEEGLRIATQYGMSDFAQELIGMKAKDKCESGKDVLAYHSDSADKDSTHSSADKAHSSSVFEQFCGKTTPKVKASTTCKSLAAALKGVPLFSEEYNNTLSGEPILPKRISSPAADKSSHTLADSTAINVDSAFTQGSTTHMTTITTKTGQVIEVETRRSSRKKNGDPDYYLINGGEKRFRSGSGKRSNSSSSERSRKLSSSSTSSTPNPGTPTTTSPFKHVKMDIPLTSEDPHRRESLGHVDMINGSEMNCDDSEHKEGTASLDKRKKHA